jgi:hypothetical protein
MNTRTFVYSALLAGAVIGVLGNLPIFNLINCLLCIWVWLGGFLAVYLYRRMERGAASLTPAQGAGLGALAGLIGAGVGIVVYSLTSFISMPLFASFVRFMQIERDLPFDRVDPAAIAGSTFFFFVLDALLYPLFGAISSFITASLMRKQLPT